MVLLLGLPWASARRISVKKKWSSPISIHFHGHFSDYNSCSRTVGWCWNKDAVSQIGEKALKKRSVATARNAKISVDTSTESSPQARFTVFVIHDSKSTRSCQMNSSNKPITRNPLNISFLSQTRFKRTFILHPF